MRGALGRALALAAVAVSLAAVGCGGSSGAPAGGGGASGGGASGSGSTTGGPHGCTNVQGSCTSNNGLGCEEWAGYDATTVSSFMKGCNHPNQVWSTSPCVTTGTVGGCEVTPPGVCNVVWAFAPVTTAGVQMDCPGASQMFVTP